MSRQFFRHVGYGRVLKFCKLSRPWDVKILIEKSIFGLFGLVFSLIFLHCMKKNLQPSFEIWQPLKGSQPQVWKPMGYGIHVWITKICSKSSIGVHKNRSPNCVPFYCLGSQQPEVESLGNEVGNQDMSTFFLPTNWQL
jgi:hypothetical protein